MNRTILVIGIIFLLIGASVVSSTGKKVEDYTVNNIFLKSVNNQKGPLSCDHLGYVFSNGQDCFLYEFILDNPDDLTCVCGGSGGYSMSGVTWSCDECIYWVEYATGILWGIDPDSCDMWEVGGGGQGLNCLAYDSVTYRMYGTYVPSGYTDVLIEVNPDTGEQTELFELDYSGGVMIGIAFDAEGVLYGWDLVTDSLWIIDIETETVEEVGTLGINLNYATPGDFCKEDDILYLVVNNPYSSNLYFYDKETGDCELIDNFPPYATVTGLVIPYECYDTTPPVTTITLDPPEPNGCNGWYVSDINVTLNATDDMSGVKTIYYKIPGDDWKNYSGDSIRILLDHDCLIGFFEFYSVDNAGNQEEIQSVDINIDQLPPPRCLWFEVVGGNPLQGWIIEITAYLIDNCSGMDRVEFYLNGGLQSVVSGPGPYYQWSWTYFGDLEVDVGVYCCDIAGNCAYYEIPIKSSRNIFQFLMHPLFFQLLERYPLLGRFLNLIQWSRI
jgi:hypothetical protein